VLQTGRSVDDTAPVFGPKARAVARLDIEGNKRRKVLVVIAAYQDAGSTPSVRDIAKRCGLRDWRHVDVLLKRLRKDGLLQVKKESGKRNVYSLTCLGGGNTDA
jgi:predicted transcriptional regulator